MVRLWAMSAKIRMQRFVALCCILRKPQVFLDPGELITTRRRTTTVAFWDRLPGPKMTCYKRINTSNNSSGNSSVYKMVKNSSNRNKTNILKPLMNSTNSKQKVNKCKPEPAATLHHYQTVRQQTSFHSHKAPATHDQQLNITGNTSKVSSSLRSSAQLQKQMRLSFMPNPK